MPRLGRNVVVLLCTVLCAACIQDSPSVGELSGATESSLGDTTTSVTTTEGETSAETETSSETTAETTSETETETSDSGFKFDVESVDANDEPPVDAEDWVVTVNNIGGEAHLFHVDIATAETTDICVIQDLETGQPYAGASRSLTFTRDDRLMHSSGGILREVLLPECDMVRIGEIGYGNVNGILPDEGNELYGISGSDDNLLAIDTGTGAGSVVGLIEGIDFFALGATWVESEAQILMLSSQDDSLYDIDKVTAMPSLVATLDMEIGNVGFEYHPLNGRYYACSGDLNLWEITPDGSVTIVGPMAGLEQSCANLGAPWSDGVILPEG